MQKNEKLFTFSALGFVITGLSQLGNKYLPQLNLGNYLIETWWLFHIAWASIFIIILSKKTHNGKGFITIATSGYIVAFMIFGFLIGQSWNLGWQLPLGVSMTVVVASLSLITTLHHSYAIRQHNRLQVKPHFIIESNYNTTVKDGFQTYTISVKNVGLGPGLISKYNVWLGEKEIKNSDEVFTEFLKIVNKKTSSNGTAEVIALYLSEHEALDKGGEKILFQVSIPNGGKSFMAGREVARQISNEIQIFIEYSCHYGSILSLNRKKNDK